MNGWAASPEGWDEEAQEEWRNYIGKRMEINWVDGYFNNDDPSHPVGYRINTDNIVYINSYSTDSMLFTLQYHVAYDIEGRIRNFYQLKKANYNYVNYMDSYQTMFLFNIILGRNICMHIFRIIHIMHLILTGG